MPSSSSILHDLFESIDRLGPPSLSSPRTDSHLAKYLSSDPSSTTGGDGLYVARRLLNAAELQAWWKTVHPEGTAPVVDPDSHLTVAYSAVRPDNITLDPNPLEVPASGIIGFDTLGKDHAIVLKVRSADLDSRFRALQSAGTTSSYPSYTPHVTLCYLPEGSAPLDVPDAYPQLPNFSLKFGPEISGPIRGHIFAKSMEVPNGSSTPFTFTAYRGSLKDRPLGPGHTFMTTMREAAENYARATPGGAVHTITGVMHNPVRGNTVDLQEKLGYEHMTSDRKMIDRARALGHDGILIGHPGRTPNVIIGLDHSKLHVVSSESLSHG